MEVEHIIQTLTVRVTHRMAGGLTYPMMQEARVLADKRVLNENEAASSSYQWSYADTERIDHRTVDFYYER